MVKSPLSKEYAMVDKHHLTLASPDPNLGQASPISSSQRAISHTVCVVGAGYVGLTAAACLAHLGHHVRCLESDVPKLELLKSGVIPIVEPDLAELVHQGLFSGRLLFTNDAHSAMAGAKVALLCVGTPPRRDGDPDLSYLAQAARTASQHATRDLVLVVKSTVPPGSCEAIELISEESIAQGLTVKVASSPEFLRESHAVYDFLNPDRVVIGTNDEAVADLVAELYPTGVPIVRCDRRGAELVKYAANAFLAVKISFANEVAALCEALGTESETVLRGVGLDHRIGPEFLQPGAGYGGSCLPKDVAGFQALGRSMHTATPIVSAAAVVNEQARRSALFKLDVALGGLAGKRIGVLGIAFKPDTDDSRDSPALHLIEMLSSANAIVRAYDPLAKADRISARRVDSAIDAISGADAIVFATGWSEFKLLDPGEIAKAMRGRVVLDTAGCVDIAKFAQQGLVVYGVGRGSPLAFHPIVWSPLRWAHPRDDQDVIQSDTTYLEDDLADEKAN